MNPLLTLILTLLFVLVPIAVFIVYAGLVLYFRRHVETLGERPGITLLRGLYRFFLGSLLAQLANVGIGLFVIAAGPLGVDPALGAIIFVGLFLAAQIFRATAQGLFIFSVTRTLHVPEAVISIDVASTIVFANEPAHALFGWPPGSLLGHNLTELQPERFRAAHLDAIARYVKSGARSIDWDAVHGAGLRKDGTEFPAVIVLNEHLVEGTRLFTGVIRPEAESHVAAS